MARFSECFAFLCCSVAMVSQGAMAAPPSSSAPTGEALGQCFVEKTSAEDRIGLIRWMVGALGSSDKVSSVVKVDAAALDKANREVAALFSRIITKDCVHLAAPLMKTEGQRVFQIAGEALGRTAMQDMMTDPKAVAALMGYLPYIDHIALGKLALSPDPAK